MIVKIGERGDDPRGIITYLGGPGTLDEHIDPHIVAASITPTGALDKELQDQAVADLRVNQRLWPDVVIKGGHVWHSTLAIGKNEGSLPDVKWRDISRDYIQGMGFQDTNWVSVNHGPSAKGNDHVHVVASLVTDQGTQAKVWQERYRSQKLAAELEDKHGLEPLPGRRQGLGSQASSQKDLARARDQGLPESRRSEIERTVRASANVVSDLEAFKYILKANGLEFHPYVSSGGTVTGYSVSSVATKTKQGVVHRWAGGKLARDLSLPRLQEVWKSAPTKRPTHIRAVQELQDLQRALPKADGPGLEDASHQLAGALASASLATEKDGPGELAAASKQAGQYAQTVRANLRPKPPALSVGLLLLQAADPSGPVGKAVMIKQLMAAYRALLDAQRARRELVTTRERNPSMAGQAGPEDELLDIGVTTSLTAGAVLVEHHARAKEAAAQMTAKDPKKDLWTAKDIRRFRQEHEAAERAKTQALKPPSGTPMITKDQLFRADRVAEALDLPSVVLLAKNMTEREAGLYLAEMEAKVVRPVPAYTPPLSPDEFEARLEAKHGHTITPLEEFAEKYATPRTPAPDLPYGGPGQRPAQGPAEQLAADLHRPDTWKTGDVPATAPQVQWLVKNAGMAEEDAVKMTKAGASSYRNALERSQAAAVHLTPVQTPKAPPRVPRQGRN
jgi:hypothetical protein